jgi:predicted RNA methylase
MTQLDLIEGTTRDLTLSQYFTPPKLAQRVVDWAGVFGRYPLSQSRVLEPSAGNGALVRPLVAAGAHVTAVELDLRYVQDLANALGLGTPEHRMVTPANFLECSERDLRGRFDLCVMNPPYHDNLCAQFIVHALKFVPRVVAILQADIFYTATRFEALWKHTRPTRAAFCVRRPWKGAETDYVVVEFVSRQTASGPALESSSCQLEWWTEGWF